MPPAASTVSALPTTSSGKRNDTGHGVAATPTGWLPKWLAGHADLPRRSAADLPRRSRHEDVLQRPGHADLARLCASSPMLDMVVDEIDGRRIRVGDHWLDDFGSCNYLGFDLDPEIIDAIPGYVARWGTHPSWSRILASPALYPEIEHQLTALLGAEDSLALPTITHIHTAVIPLLAGGGTLYLDRKAHKTIYDGSSLAKARGTDVLRFRHNDLDHLEELLRAGGRGPRVICTDGVNSMTGNVPDLAAMAWLAREHDALLYVDDAHGFGVIGERSLGDTSGYGRRGNSIVRHFGETYDNVVLVGGFSKAYSSLLAFIACPTALKEMLKVAAPPYAYSGPSPVASLATVLAGLKVNEERGDAIRDDLARKTRLVLTFLDAADIYTPNQSGFPVIQIPLADPDRIDEVGAYLFEQGIYVTLAAYPIVPRNEVGFRIQVTAANTDEEVTHLMDVLAAVADRFRLWTSDGWAEAHDGVRATQAGDGVVPATQAGDGVVPALAAVAVAG